MIHLPKVETETLFARKPFHHHDMKNMMRLKPYVRLSRNLDKALSKSKVHVRHKAPQANAQEHLCSCLLVFGTSKQSHCATMKVLMPRTHDEEVDELWMLEAVGVIEPGDKALHNH